MATPRNRLRLVLLQIRNDLVPLKQEQHCFIERCGVEPGQIEFINLVDEPEIRWRHVENAHAVLIGGAGAFSVTRKHPFTSPLRDVVHRLIDEGRPVFGSCWGHQFLADMDGGKVIGDEARSEVGTFPIELTPEGKADPIFAELPDRFYVQFGHKDRVSELGPDWLDLAHSDLCPFQAIRLRDKPVYGTQFHSEMNEERLHERILVYLEDYVADEEEHRRIISGLRPSPESDRLLQAFLELHT